MTTLNDKYKINELHKRMLVEKAEEEDILNQLGFKLTFKDVISLLKDEKRLKEVTKKLKLQALW